MHKTIFKVIAATALFAGLHTLLATRHAKVAATTLFGIRRRNALYRPFYNSIALVTTASLMLYLARLPDRELYRVRRPFSGLMIMIQIASFLCLLRGVLQVGLLRFSGLTNFSRLLVGERTIVAEPEGQGPALGGDGHLKVTGPFRWSRHPLNFWMVPLLWLWPRMTVKLATFNAAVTLYLWAGSLHEEARLEEAYPEEYALYQASGVGFFVPSPGRLVSERRTVSMNKQVVPKM